MIVFPTFCVYNLSINLWHAKWATSFTSFSFISCSVCIQLNNFPRYNVPCWRVRVTLRSLVSVADVLSLASKKVHLLTSQTFFSAAFEIPHANSRAFVKRSEPERPQNHRHRPVAERTQDTGKRCCLATVSKQAFAWLVAALVAVTAKFAFTTRSLLWCSEVTVPFTIWRLDLSSTAWFCLRRNMLRFAGQWSQGRNQPF